MALGLKNRYYRCILAVLIALFLFGCDAELKENPKIIGRQDLLRPSLKYFPKSGNIESIVLGSGPDVTLLIASIHGNEQAGTPLLGKMAEHLRADSSLLIGRKVVLVPVANPDGVLRNSRYNANGVDLNRNFKTANRHNNKRNGYVGLSEPESRHISRLIDHHRPDRMVTIHQPLNCIDYDGPSEAKIIAEKMASHCDLPVKKLGAKPGSLGSYVGTTLKKPIITVELPRSADKLNDHELWQKYGKMLLACVTYRQLDTPRD